MARAQRECHIGVGYNRTQKLREKLIREITNYERQLEAQKMQSGPVDFSMLQTLKEMIACRQAALRNLPQDQ